MKFLYKLLLLFGISLFVIGAFFSIYTYFNNKATLEKEINDKLKKEAQDAMTKIDMMLFERYSTIQTLANLPKIRAKDTSFEEITSIFINFRNFYKSYASISLFDINRTRLVDTSGLKIGEQHELTKYWEDVLDGKVSSGSDLRVAEELGVPVIYFASPVRDSEEKIYRAVVSRVPVSKIYDILGEDLGEAGIDLLDRNGMFLFSSYSQKEILKGTFPNWDKIKELSKDSDAGSTIMNLDGEKNIVVFTKEKGYLDYNGNDWTLIMHLPTKTAFALINKASYTTGIIFIIMLFIFSSFIVFFSRRMLKPLSEIYFATKEIEKGNFKAKTSVKSNDEFEELGNAFNKMSDSLEISDEERKGVDKAKTEFLSITSHELRSPMTPMQAQLQMLIGNYFGRLNPKEKESIDIVLRNTQRLDKIIQDFLEISRIEAARLKFNFVKTSLNEPIKRVIDEMKGFLPEKKIVIENKIEKLPIIEVDPDRVMQVLRNLLNNAIKFSKDNGKIIISAKSEGGMILFSVQDFGEGIPAQDQRRIFEPFFQAGGMYQRKFGGTGLGLAICKGIIESQKGRIWFESQEGKGTTFHFSVPLIPVKEIAPIKLLFSPKTGIEKKVKELLVEYLGPVGESEFSILRNQGLDEKSVKDYADMLIKKGILNKEKAELLEESINLVLKGEEVKIKLSDLEKFGFIKAEEKEEKPEEKFAKAFAPVSEKAMKDKEEKMKKEEPELYKRLLEIKKEAEKLKNKEL